MSSRKVGSMLAAAVLVLATTGCYHYNFEQRTAVPGARLTTYQERRPTYLNGFLGTGTVDTAKYCAEPVRTELRVTGADVLLSVVTLLIYTPHTLYVTCSEPAPRAVTNSVLDARARRTLRPAAR
jgi:hypothetical protein